MPSQNLWDQTWAVTQLSMVAVCFLFLPSKLGTLPRCRGRGIRLHLLKGRCQGFRKTCRIGSFSRAVLGKPSVIDSSSFLPCPDLCPSHPCDEDSSGFRIWSRPSRVLPLSQHETGSGLPFFRDKGRDFVSSLGPKPWLTWNLPPICMLLPAQNNPGIVTEMGFLDYPAPASMSHTVTGPLPNE